MPRYCHATATDKGRLQTQSRSFKLNLNLKLVVLASLAISVLLSCWALNFCEQAQVGDMLRTHRYVCMGCQTHATGLPGHTQFFDTYKAAACHYARSAQCNRSGRSIRMVTVPSQSRSNDWDAGGSGAAGQWAPPQTAFTGGI